MAGVKRLLLELDATIDTRLGTMAILDPDALQKMDLKHYLCRIDDEFESPKFTKELYKIAYENRDTHTLRNGIVTGILRVVKDALREFIMNISGSKPAVLEIDLNIYPYYLSDEERTELEGVVEFELDGMAKVKTIRVEPARLTLRHLAANYHTCIFYNWVEWATAIDASFRTEMAPQVNVIVPALLQGKEIPDDLPEDEKAAMEKMGPFNAMELQLIEKISLSFDKVAYFSIRT